MAAGRVTEAGERFAYHRSVAPMLWMFLAVAATELVVVHLVVSLWWSWKAAVSLSLISAVTILWLLRVVLSMPARPVLLDESRLVMRVGTLKRVDVPLAAVRGLRTDWDEAALRGRGVLRLSLLAYPNVVVEIDPPVGPRGVTRIAHRLDAPDAFMQALCRLTAAR